MTTPREQATTQTSATVSPIERAIAEADEACPCRHADGILLDVRDPHMCEQVCVCVVGAIHDHLTPVPSCRQSIHTAIRRAVRVALEEAIATLWERSKREEYGHAKAAVMLDIEAIQRLLPPGCGGEDEA